MKNLKDKVIIVTGVHLVICFPTKYILAIISLKKNDHIKIGWYSIKYFASLIKEIKLIIIPVSRVNLIMNFIY